MRAQVNRSHQLGLLAFVCMAALVSSGQAQKPEFFGPQGNPARDTQDLGRQGDGYARADLWLTQSARLGMFRPTTTIASQLRPIYKSYPVYVPGHESPGHELPAYMEWLKQQEPEIVWGLDPESRR